MRQLLLLALHTFVSSSGAIRVRILGPLLCPALVFAAPAYGPELQGFNYPYPVATFEFSSQRERMHMAYMDVQPPQGNGRTIVLLHGM